MKTNEKMNQVIKFIMFAIGIIAIIVALQFGKAKYVFNKENPTEIHFYEYRILSDEIKISPEVYTGGNVEITISTNKQGVDIQYQINNGEWTNYIGPFSVSENCVINTRYTAENFIGPVTSRNIENVAIAKFKDVNYVTLAEAIEAYISSVDTEEKIELLADINESVEIPENEYVAIDLAGHKIESENNYVFTVNGILDLIDSAETKGLVNAQNGAAILIGVSGKVILGTEYEEGIVDNGPVIMAETNGIVIENINANEIGIVIFNDGTISAKQDVFVRAENIEYEPAITVSVGYGILNKTEDNLNIASVRVIQILSFNKVKEDAQIDIELMQILNGDIIRELPEVSLTGYTLSGWYTGEGENKEVISENTIVTRDLNIYAEWTPNTYEIEYKPNGANGNMKNTECIYDEDSPISECEFVLDGYTFIEWNTKEDGTGVKYNENEIISNLTTINNDTITVYAIWKDVTAPSNNKPSVVSTTSTISVLMQQIDEGSKIDTSTIQYSISTDNNIWSDWVNGSNTYTFTNLDYNKTYYVRTKVTDNAGNIGISESAEIKTKKIETTAVNVFKYVNSTKDREVAITSTTALNPDWINSDILVDVTVPTIENGVTIIAKVEKENNILVTKNITSDNDDFIVNTTEDGEYVITVTSTDNYNFVINKYYVYIDKTNPDVDFECETTSNSISVIKHVTENESGIESISIQLKDGDTVIEENATGIFENLTSGKEYTVVVSAVDIAGNKLDVSRLVSTEELKIDEIILEGTDSNNTFIPSEDETVENVWINEDVVVKIPEVKYGTVTYTVEPVEETTSEITVLGENEVKSSEILSEDEIESSKLLDVTEEKVNSKILSVNEEKNSNEIRITQEGSYVLTITITDGTNTVIKKYYFNIDKTAPQVLITPNGNNYLIGPNNTSKTVNVILEASDNEKGSGIATRKYAWSNNSTVEPTEWLSFIDGETIEKALTGGKYYLWTMVEDKAGNRALNSKVSNVFNVEYLVKYNLQGGNATIENQRKEFGNNLTLSTIVPEKEGYRFKGWSTNFLDMNVEYMPGGVYSKDEAVVLYAVWSELISYVEKEENVVYYENIQDAINDAKTTATEITLLKDTTENIVIAEGQNIVLNMSGNVLKANGTAVTNNGTFAFKDGVIKGTTQAINGEVTNIQTGYRVVNGTETINETVYQTASLSNYYNVTIDVNGGKINSVNGWNNTESVLNKNVQHGNVYGQLPTVSKVGYTFEGWNIKVGSTVNTSKYITDTTIVSIANEHELVANWSPNLDTPYVVYHYRENANGVDYELVKTENLTGITDSFVSISELSGVAEINNTIRLLELENCSYEKALTEFGEEITGSINIEPDGSTKVYMYYLRNKFPLNIVAGINTVSATGSGTYRWGESINITGKIANVEGYAYANFAWKNSSIAQIMSDSVVAPATKASVVAGEIVTSTIIMPASNTSVSATAERTPITYNLVFNGNGGTLIANNPATYNVEQTIELNGTTKQGYVFAGWQLTKLNGETVTAQPTITTIPKGTIGNREYTAVYANGPSYYTVYHYVENANDDEYTIQQTEIIDSTTNAVIKLDNNLAKTIEHASYKLSTTNLGGSQGSSVIVHADGSTKIYVYYNRSKYLLKLEKDSNISNLKINDKDEVEGNFKYGSTVSISASTANLSGYTYSNFRWTTTDTSILASTTNKVTTLTMPGSNVTITARADRSVVGYSISYELNGGTVTETNPTTYNVETAAFTLNNPTKKGYTFIGWTGSNGTIPQTNAIIVKGTTGNKSYTANWKKNNYEELNGTEHIAYYETLAEAFEGITNGNTITTLDNVSENIKATLSSGKIATLSLKDNTTINLNSVNIVNNGNLTIEGTGTLTSAVTLKQGDYINSSTIGNTGTLNIAGGIIISSSEGARTISNVSDGAINISGGIIKSTGSNSTLSNSDTITNINGTITITGGTIKSLSAAALTISSGNVIITGGIVEGQSFGIWMGKNNPSVTIGDNSSEVSINSPQIIANATSNCGVYITSGGIFNIYGGIIKSPNETIQGTITDIASGYVVVNGTETIGTTTYKTAMLGPSVPVITAKITDESGTNYTSGTWTKNNIYVSLASDNIGAGIKQYEWKEGINGTWKVGSMVTSNNIATATFTEERNSTIYFRAVDNNGVCSLESSIVMKIDKTAPTYSSIEIKNITTTGYDVYVYNVTDSGSGVNRVQFPTWTLNNGQDDIQSSWQTNTNAKGTLQSDGTTWIYRVNTTDHNNEAGEYITHIYFYDGLGNSKGVGISNIGNPIVPSVQVTFDSGNLLYGLVNVGTTSNSNGTYSVSNGVVTVTGKTNDGYTVTNGRVYLEANKKYSFSCTSDGTRTSNTGGVEAYLLRDGISSAGYFIVMSSFSNYEFTPTVTGTYHLRLDVNKTGQTNTFSNIVVKSITTVEYGYGSTLGTLPTYTRTGHTFNGLFTSSSGGTEVTSSTAVPSTNTTYYGQWSVNNYYIDLNMKVNDTDYTTGYDDRIYVGLKINGTNKGYVKDYYTQHPYGTSWEIYGIKIDNVVIPYTAKGNLGAAKASIWIEFYTLTLNVNNSSYGSISPTSYLVPTGTKYSTSGATLTLSDKRTVTATPIDLTGYTTKLSDWSSTSGTINSATTITANFSRTINTYTLTINPNGGTYKNTTSNSTISGKFNEIVSVVPPTPPSGKTFNSWTITGGGLFKSAMSTPSSGSFTKTSKSDDAGTYWNYTKTINAPTNSDWANFGMSTYSFVPDHKYTIRGKVRVNSLPTGVNITFRHSCIYNDYGSKMVGKTYSAATNGWVDFSMSRTFASGDVYTVGSGSYSVDGGTVKPQLVMYSTDMKGKTGTFDFDVRNLTIIDETLGTIVQTSNSIYIFDASNATFTANYVTNSTTSSIQSLGGEFEQIENEELLNGIEENNIIIEENNSNNSEKYTEEKYIAEINNTKYTTLQEAVNNVKENEIIKLLEDVELEETLNILENQTVQLDLNCKNINSKAIETINNEGNLIIKSMGIIRNETSNGTVIYNSGILKLENGILTSASNGAKVVDNHGLFEMFGGKIVIEGIGSSGVYNEVNAEMNMSSGIIEVTGFSNKAIYNNSKLFVGKLENEQNVKDSSEQNINVENKQEDNSSNEQDVNIENEQEKEQPKIIVSNDDSIGIYNSKDTISCIISNAQIVIEAEEIEDYELIKDTIEFAEEYEQIKSSYGIYNESIEEINIEKAIIIVQRLKAVGIQNNSSGNIVLGIEDEEVNDANPIIYAISDRTMALGTNEDSEGEIIMYDGRMITSESVKDKIKEVLEDYYLYEDKNSSIISLMLKEVETISIQTYVGEEI